MSAFQTVAQWVSSLPGPLRNIAATAYGYYLRSQRYSRNTNRLVREAIAREKWTREQWAEYQTPRMEAMLRHAALQSPYYRKLWQSAAMRGKSPENLADWPILSKEQIRQAPRNFLAPRPWWRRLAIEHTSGTTGTPIEVWQNRATLESWYALMEARWRGWNGVSRKQRWAILGGKHIAPLSGGRPPYWVWNGGLNQLYLSIWHTQPEVLVSYLKAIQSCNVTYLWGHSSCLYWLAIAAEEAGLRPPLTVAIANAEPLHDYQRQQIARAFGCRVVATFGQTEKVCAASECEHGRLHLWPELGTWELLDEADRPVPRGAPGRLICTSLINRVQPLIRYETGDLLQLPHEEILCECGRTLPVVERIVGRQNDVVVTPDGRKLAHLDAVFELPLAMREGQIIQETRERLRVRIVPAPEWHAGHAAKLKLAVQELVGAMDVQIESVPKIERTAGGKLRTIVCQLPLAELPTGVHKPP